MKTFNEILNEAHMKNLALDIQYNSLSDIQKKQLNQLEHDKLSKLDIYILAKRNGAHVSDITDKPYANDYLTFKVFDDDNELIKYDFKYDKSDIHSKVIFLAYNKTLKDATNQRLSFLKARDTLLHKNSIISPKKIKPFLDTILKGMK